MFKFDNSIPFQCLLGSSISWVCFSASGCKLKFLDNSAINIINFDKFCEQSNSTVIGMRDILLTLIGISISGISVISNSEMQISFNSRTTLCLLDEDGDFENFIFSLNDKDYIV